MKKTILITTMLMFAMLTNAQTTTTYTKTYTSGTGTWSAPEGAYQITKIQAWGGGGAGGGANRKASRHRVGQSGGGGAYSESTNVVTLNNTRSASYTVGSGGTGSSGDGTNGGNSTLSYNGTIIVKADGGKGGSCNHQEGWIIGASGGLVSNCIGTTKYSGGAGGQSYANDDWTSNNSGTGGGGGAADASGSGNKGTDYNYSSASAGNGGAGKGNGGAGGNGVKLTNATSYTGNSGKTYGGGGSGASFNCWNTGSKNGGSGAAGAVIITYTTLTLTVTFDNNYTGGGTSTKSLPYYNTINSLSQPNPTRSCYSFGGWYLDAACTQAANLTEHCTKTTNFTLYAKWNLSATISEPENDYYVWTGANSTDWSNSANWLKYNDNTYSAVATAPNNNTHNVIISTSTCFANNNPSMTAAISVKNLKIKSGKTLNIGNKTLNIAGNLENTGTLTATSGCIVFNGSSNQTISNNVTLGDVTFNQSSTNTITAANGITVNGTATFTNGIVNGDMTFGSSSSTTGASVNSFVLGTVTKQGNGQPFTFPTGAKSSDDSNAMNVLGTATASITNGATVSVKFNSAATKETGDHRGYGFTEEDGFPRFWNTNDMCVEGNAEGAAPFSSVSNYEYWTIETTEAIADLVLRSEASGTDAWKAHFKEEPTDDPDVYEASTGLAMRSDCGWMNAGGEALITDDFSVVQITVNYPGSANNAKSTRAGSSITGFGTVNKDAPLPIELVSFSAECDGNAALVSWTTATERNNEYFVLERSADAQNFNEVARIAGAGNSLEPIDYSFTDYDMYGGNNYYRLWQVDFDGNRTASEIITVNCKEAAGEPSVVAYPNPFYGDITVRLENFNNRPVQIEIFDVLGKLVAMEKVDAPQNYYETTMNLQHLTPATYSIRVASDETVIVKKVVKQ